MANDEVAVDIKLLFRVIDQVKADYERRLEQGLGKVKKRFQAMEAEALTRYREIREGGKEDDDDSSE